MHKDHCIAICNLLLKTERSAVDTYARAISAYDPQRAPAELTRILRAHQEAVISLERQLHTLGGTPTTDAALWGSFAAATTGVAAVLGEKSSLHCLQAGEKTGQRDYTAALADTLLREDCKTLIRTTLLPQVVEHISAVERLQRR